MKNVTASNMRMIGDLPIEQVVRRQLQFFPASEPNAHWSPR
jgi:hypothetical protein